MDDGDGALNEENNFHYTLLAVFAESILLLFMFIGETNNTVLYNTLVLLINLLINTKNYNICHEFLYPPTPSQTRLVL